MRVLDWYQHQRPAYGWGAVIHRRNERGRLRFGAITPGGESLLLTEPLAALLRRSGRVVCVVNRTGRSRLLACATCGELARCDRCGAQAYVRAVLATSGGELLFCGHHARAVEPTLRPQTVEWQDETNRLHEKPAFAADED